MDEILREISESGAGSLTEAEKKLLNEVSERSPPAGGAGKIETGFSHLRAEGTNAPPGTKALATEDLSSVLSAEGPAEVEGSAEEEPAVVGRPRTPRSRVWCHQSKSRPKAFYWLPSVSVYKYQITD